MTFETATRDEALLDVQTYDLSAETAVLRASGALDAATQSVLSDHVRAGPRAHVRNFVLDLTGVSELDRLGAVVLLEIAHRTVMHEVRLYLVPSTAVTAMLDELQVRDRFTILPAVPNPEELDTSPTEPATRGWQVPAQRTQH